MKKALAYSVSLLVVELTLVNFAVQFELSSVHDFSVEPPALIARAILLREYTEPVRYIIDELTFVLVSILIYFYSFNCLIILPLRLYFRSVLQREHTSTVRY